MAPTACTAPFPMPFHRTMAQVMADEANGCFCEMVNVHDDADDCGLVARLIADLEDA